MTARIDEGALVTWLRDGQAEYGIVEGRRGTDEIFVRRVDGHRGARAHCFPKPAGDLLLLATPGELRYFLDDRARVILGAVEQRAH